MKRILIAAASERAAEGVARVMSPHFAVTVCTTFQAALTQLEEGVDFVICGMHFDSGRMFDLLGHVRENPKTRNIPFLCCKSTQGVLSLDVASDATVRSIQLALQASGAGEFIDLADWRRKFGDDAAYEKFRDQVGELLRDDNGVQDVDDWIRKQTNRKDDYKG